MKLFQIFLPLYSNQKEAFAIQLYLEIRDELKEVFGGITAYNRSPATGLWKENEDKTVRDEIIIYEVMASEIDEEWWDSYKAKLKNLFKQQEILIRVMDVTLL